MRIAIFSDTFPPQINGVANVAWQSAKNLAGLGHEVVVFTISKNGKNGLKLNSGNPAVVYLPSIPAWVYPDERLTAPIGMSFNRLRKFRPDVIHTHTPFTVGWEAVWGAKLLRVPLVGTHHTFYDHYLKHAKIDYEWGKKFSCKCTIAYYNRCDLILSPSQSLYESLLVQGLKKPVEILSNSIDIKLFSPVSDAQTKTQLKKSFGIDGQSLIYMGRLSYEKSIDIVIKAFALMLEKRPDLKLMIVGDGPERLKLERLAADLGINEQIIFTGALYGENLVKALRASDVYLTACKNENMPLAVLEIMAAGLPAVVVKEKGLAEIIKENVNGFFAKTDDPQNMAQKALELLTKPDLLEKFGQTSRRLTMEYSHERIGKMLEQTYKKLIKRKV